VRRISIDPDQGAVPWTGENSFGSSHKEEIMQESLMELTSILVLVVLFGAAWSLLARYGTLHTATPWRLVQLLAKRGRTLADVRENDKPVATFRCNTCDNTEACDKWRRHGLNPVSYRRFCPNAELVDDVTSARAS
jgi:hypothetical protein